MSIQEIVLKIKGRIGNRVWEQCNHLVRLFLWVIIAILIASLGYMTGRITLLRTVSSREEIAIIYPSQPLVSSTPFAAKRSVEPSATKAPSVTTNSKSNGVFIGSKTGRTYYPEGCKGINRIKIENRVYFKSIAEAQTRGYQPSKACGNSL